MKAFITFALSSALLSLPVFATESDNDNGRVKMRGAIIVSACTIDAGNQDQTVDFEQKSITDVMRDQRNATQAFSLRLTNCILSDTLINYNKRNFDISFDGEKRDGLFNVSGKSRGLAFSIDDAQSHQLQHYLSSHTVDDSGMALNYIVHFQHNHQTLVEAGDYYSSVRMKMDYH